MSHLSIAFGEYLPDLPPLKNPGLITATNVIPFGSGYKPFLGLTTISTNTLGDRCRGIISARDRDGNVYTFAGDGTKLYSIVNNAWSNVSKSGNYTLATDDFWEFTQFLNQVIAVNFSTATQAITLAGSNFADLFTSTLKPKARRCAVVRDFLVLGYTNDAVDGNVPQRVWWSGIGDTADMDPSATTQSDYQDLPGANGGVQKIVGGEFGTVFMRKAIYRMTYEGPPTVFRFDEVATNRGTIEGNSVIKIGRIMAFLDEDGFYLTDGTDVVPIGDNKINRTFKAELDSSYVSRISVAYDPTNACIMWAYPATGNNGIPNRIVIYNMITKRWSKAELSVNYLFSDLTKGYTLDSLDSLIPDIDNTSVSSFDSALLTGGTPLLGAIDTSNQLAYFTGSALAAVLDTGDIQPFDGLRTAVSEVRPIVDGTAATTTIQIGTRENLQTANSFGTAESLNSNGAATFNTSARYVRLRTNISGGFDHAQGLECQVNSAGVQ